MGKSGPCCHCGITSTPLWRNGPPGKPVLCNACGSRWRTKGSLANYTPQHARLFTSFDSEDSRNSQEDKLSSMTYPKNLRIKIRNNGEVEGEMFTGYGVCPTGFDDDTSNRSSSGSAISCSESCIQLGSMDGNEISGSVQSSFWDSQIPSRKRSSTKCQSPSPVEKLRKDLFDILQEQESSYLSGSSEEVLIFEREDSMFSAEIGLGSVLLKPPATLTEDESEASSLVTENKASCLNATHMGSSCMFVESQSSEISSSQIGNNRLVQDIGDTEELIEDPAKQSAPINMSVDSPFFLNPELESKHSHQININIKPSNIESCKPGKEISSCSSRLTRGGISLPAKRRSEPPYFQISGGMSSEISGAFKRPKERMVVEDIYSSKTSLPDLSLNRNSRMLSSKVVQVEQVDKNLQRSAHSDVSRPLDGPPYTPLHRPRTNLDEETISAANMFQYPDLFL